MLLCPLTLPAQGVLDESWFLTREGPQHVQDMAWGVEVDDLRQIYWVTTQTVSGFNVGDIFTYKLDADGNEVWPEPHDFGGLYEQQAYNTLLDGDVLYVAGRTWTGYFLLSFSDALLYALDVNTRDTLWTYVYDSGFGYEEVDGLVRDGDYLYISGWAQSEDDNQQLFLTKLTLDGEALWTTVWGSPGYDQCDGHCVVDDSLVYLSGLYNLPEADAVLAAFDKESGAYRWHRLWGGAGLEDALGMGTDGTYLYQCGVTTSHADSSVFLLRYDKQGNLDWWTATDKAIKARSMAFAPDGVLYLAATTNTLGAGDEDLIVMRFDPESGEELSYRTWGGSKNESVQDIRLKDGYLYLTGRTLSYSANSFDDALLVKAPIFDYTGIPPVSSGELAKSTLALRPNPARETVHLAAEELLNCPCTLFVRDEAGRFVDQHYFPEAKDALWSPVNQQNGLYHLLLLDREGASFAGSAVFH